MDVKITRHAYKRAHQRMGLSKQALDRIIPRVLESSTKTVQGQFTHIDHNSFRFIFMRNKLVTVLHEGGQP